VQPIAQLKTIIILYIAIRHKTKQKYKMKKFMKVKMVKTVIGRQFIIESWYQFNGINHLVDRKIVNDLKSWL
jgi:hypothetical protein